MPAECGDHLVVHPLEDRVQGPEEVDVRPGVFVLAAPFGFILDRRGVGREDKNPVFGPDRPGKEPESLFQVLGRGEVNAPAVREEFRLEGL